MQIQGKTYRDLFYLVRNTCYTKTHNTYVESQYIRAYCPACGETGTRKLDDFCWTGLPDQAPRGHLDHHETSELPLPLQSPGVVLSGPREESRNIILMSGEAIAMP